MAFEGLSDKLESAFKKLKSKGSLTEADVREAMRGNTVPVGSPYFAKSA